MSQRGRFITFEGPEGSGKSAQCALLVETLRTKGFHVLATREPGGTDLGNQLRELVLLRQDLQTVARAEALMMCAARAQLVETEIRPALQDGAIVVCDRFADSTLAYQGYGRGLSLDPLRAVVSFATAGLTPDLTILLDVPVELGLARKLGQQRTAASEWNRFEAERHDFHRRVRDGYLSLAAASPSQWRIFDGASPIEVLAPLVLDRVLESLSAENRDGI